MKNIFFAPITLIASTTAVSFYSLYALMQAGLRISSFVFISAISVSIVGMLFLLIIPTLHKSVWRFIPPQNVCKQTALSVHQREPPQFARRKLVSTAVLYLLCCTAGMSIGSYAELTLRNIQQPPQTLAALPSVRSIIAELTGEPLPAGSDYYRIPVRTIACTTADNKQFSLSGQLQVLVPAALIRGTYAGGIIRIGKQPPLPDSPLFLNTATSFQHFLHDAQPCRFYARGMRLFVTGGFSKNGTVFYAKPMQPIFLGWSSTLRHVRAQLRFAFMRMLYSWGNAGGLLLALLAADKAFLPESCVEAFRNAGLAHILALSGMHLSLIGTAALQGGRLLGHKKRAVYVSLIAVCIFVWFAGSAPSLNRALGMVFIAAIGEALGLKPPVFSVLCMMLTIHITFGSAEAVTLGFMLSYGACAGILIFGDACASLVAGTILPAIGQSLAASIGAQLFTAPIVIGAIGTAAAGGIIASCIVSPLVSLFLIGGLIAIPLALLFPLISTILGHILNGCYHVIFSAANFFAHIPLIVPKTPLQRGVFSAAAFAIGIFLTTAAYLHNKKAMQHIPSLT